MNEKVEIVIGARDDTRAAFTSVSSGLSRLSDDSVKAGSSARASLAKIGEGFSAGFSNSIRNASYQISDFIVQVQGGQKVSLALSQQLPQLLAGFGTLGAVAGVVAGILPSVFTAMGFGVDTTKKLDDAVGELSSSLGDVGKVTGEFDMTKVYEEFNKSSVAVRHATVDQLEFQKAFIETKQLLAEKSLAKTLEGVGQFSFLDKLKGAFGDTQAEKLSKELGISLSTAQDMVPALNGIRNGSEDAANFMARFGIELAKSGNQPAQSLLENINAVAKGGREAAAAQSKLTEALEKTRKAGDKGIIPIPKKEGRDSNRIFNDYDSILAERIAKAIEGTDTVKAAELVSLLEKLDQLSAAGLDPAIVKEIRDDLTGATKDANEQLERLNSLLSDTPTTQLEAVRSDMKLLSDALESGFINTAQYMEAVESRLSKFGKEAKDAGNEVDEFAKNAAKGMQDALADFLFDPFKHGTQGMLQGFGQMIQKMIAQAVAADIGKRLFGGLVKGGEGDGMLGGALNWLGSVLKLNADGGVYAGAGIGAYSGTIVSRPTVFPFAKGVGLMGEAGPEAILPLKRGSDGKLGVSAGSGHAITVNISMTDGDPAKVRRAAAAGAREAMAMINGARRYG